MVVTSGGRQLTVVGGAEATKLLRLAESAHLPEHFAEVLGAMERVAGTIKWLPFGGRGRVAHSAIGSASSSTHLLTEPIVNMGDAELELAHQLALVRGEVDDEPGSTYEAASRYYGVPAGGLAAWDTRKGAARAAFTSLASQAQVRVRHGSRAQTPTITYLDQAIGQHPSRFEKTLLSLHLGNKAEIPYLAGQYGHGAGLTLSFSLGGQIIVARRHPELLAADEDDLVGLVLIERRMPSRTGMTNPSYWYAVPAETETPLSFAPDALGDPRWHGVRRTCINYELAKGSERDIYFALEHCLPDPALPYAFRDERTAEGDRRQWRYLDGISARLERRYRSRTARAKAGTKETHVPYRNHAYLDLTAFVGDGTDYGSAEVITTFVRQEESGRGNSLFTPADAAEIWSLNGQMHHARGRRHFGVEPVRLDAIRDFLVVEVKLDGLSADAKALLLTTDRQGAAEREIKRELERAIDDVLGSDEELRRLNDEEKERALSQAAQSRMKDLDRELVAFEYFVRNEKTTVKRKVKQWVKQLRRRGPNIALEPLSPLHEHPTFVRFRKELRTRLRISPGATTSVLLEADAVDGYFGDERQASFQFVPPMGAVLQVYAQEQLQGGRMRVRIKARDDVEFGTTLLTVSYLPPNAAAPLTDEIEVEIAPPRERRMRTDADNLSLVEVEVEIEEEVERPAPPPYEILFAEREPTWASKGMDDWSDETVGAYKNDVAYVNGDFAPLLRLLGDAKSGQQQEYLTLYAAPIIMTLVGLAKQEASPPLDEESGEPVWLHADYKSAALNGVALSSIFTIRKLRKLAMSDDPDDYED